LKIAIIVIALATGCVLRSYENVAADGNTSDTTGGACSAMDLENVCGGYACNASGTCETTCGEPSQCKESHDCVSGACELRRPRQDAVIGAPELNAVITLPLASPTLKGNTLVLVASLATTSQMIAVTDTASNIWSRATYALPAANMYPTSEIWYVANAEPITLVTVTLSAPRGIVMHVMEWPTVRRLSPLDKLGSDPGTVASKGTSGTVTTTLAKELVIGSVGAYANGMATLDTTTGFTSLRPVRDGYLSNDVAYQIGGAGTYRASWTFMDPANFTGVIASFVLD
jgi:hypothetical protein